MGFFIIQARNLIDQWSENPNIVCKLLFCSFSSNVFNPHVSASKIVVWIKTGVPGARALTSASARWPVQSSSNVVGWLPRMTWYQCDQMDRLFVRRMAIYKKEIGSIAYIICKNCARILPNTKINFVKSPMTFFKLP